MGGTKGVKVREAMTERVLTIAPERSLREAAEFMTKHNIGAAVVIDPDAPGPGIITERDVVRRLATDGPAVLDRPVADLMTTELVTCGPHDTLDDIAALMTERRIRHLPVLDAGHLAGIVSIGDVVAARLRELEQTRAQLESYIVQG